MKNKTKNKTLPNVSLNYESGFTLGEIVIVIVIIGILATVALRTMDGAVDNSRHQEAQEELDLLAEAIVGQPELVSGGVRTDFGYVGDVGALPSSLDNLVANPGGYTTWNGPYIRDDFTEDANDFKTDPWGVVYTYAGGVTVQSTGSGSNITKSLSNSSANLLSTSVRGMILDRDGTPPGSDAVNVSVELTYPNGIGGLTTASVNPNSSGAFSFSGIPIGNHNFSAVFQTANDTLTNFVTVFPRTGGFTGTLRFGTDHWSGGGGGGGSSAIAYISGTAVVCEDKKVSFTIRNTGSDAINIDWIIFTHSVSGMYLKKIKIDDNTHFDNDCDKLASGDTASLSPIYTLAPFDTVFVKFDKFKDDEGCGGDDFNVPCDTDFTVDFSDGSSINFTAPCTGNDCPEN